MKLNELLEHCELTKDQLKLECVDKHLVAISKIIGCWETCAPHFELTQAEIEEIREDGMNAEQRKLYMLRKWRQKKAFLATFGALVDIFLKCGNALMAQHVCEIFKKVTSSTEEVSEQIISQQSPARQCSNQSGLSLHSNQSYRSQHSNQSYRSQHSNQSYRSQHSNQSYRSQHSNRSSRSASFEILAGFEPGLFANELPELIGDPSQYSDKSMPPRVHCIELDPRNKELGDLCSSLCHFLNKDEHALKNMKGGLVGLGFTGDEYLNAGDVCELLRNVRRYFNHSDISFLETVIGYSKNKVAVEMVRKYASALCPDEEIPIEQETPPATAEEKQSTAEEDKKQLSTEEHTKDDKIQLSTEEPTEEENAEAPPDPDSNPVKQPQSVDNQPTIEVDLEQNASSKFLEGVMKHLVCGIPCPLLATCALEPPPSPPVIKEPSRDPIPHSTEPPPGLIEITTRVQSDSLTRGALECLKSAVASTFCFDEVMLFFSHASKSSVLVHWHISQSLVPQIESVQISPENEARLNELHVSDIVLGGRCLYLNPVYYFSEDVRSSVGPIGVKYIATDEQFDVAVEEAGDRPIVMEFVARNHPETMKIAPYFAKLSMEHLNTVFLLVDRDLCEETAGYFGIIQVPVFHFMKSGYIFPKLRIGGPRATVEQLDMNVQEIAAKPLGDKDPSDFVNLNYLIEETQSECFNTDQSLRDVLTKNKKEFLESYYDPDDEDEMENIGKLILYFSFPEAMKLQSIQILGPSGGKAPQDVQLFVNQDIRSFDDVAGRPSIPLHFNEADTTESDVNIPKILPSLPKFSNVRNLTVFVTSNQGGLPTTVVSYVGIFGEPKEGIGARAISLVDFSKFVACEAYKCPRHDK